MYVFHPVAVGVDKLGRVELNRAIKHVVEGGLADFLHAEEPLQGQTRLNHRIGALAVANLIDHVFGLDQIACGIEVFDDFLAHHEAVLADVELCLLIERGVFVEDVYQFEIVALADLVVIDIVGRGHLEATSTVLNVYVVIANDRNLAVDHGDDGFLADEVLEALIFGVDTDSGIGQDGLWAGGGDGHIVLGPGDLVAYVEEFGVYFFVDYLLIRHSGLALRVPVDHAVAAVDMSFVVEVYKYLDYGFVVALVHGEAGAVPVAGSAELLELLKDDAAVLVFPLKGMLEEFVPADLSFFDALLAEHLYHLCLGGDGSVVGAGYPAGLAAFHARFADQDILDGIVEHVAHVQDSCHIGWRDDDSVGLFVRIGSGLKESLVHPVLIPLVFYCCRIVLGGNRHGFFLFWDWVF